MTEHRHKCPLHIWTKSPHQTGAECLNCREQMYWDEVERRLNACEALIEYARAVTFRDIQYAIEIWNKLPEHIRKEIEGGE